MTEASSRSHFESSYETEFDPPRDIDFIFYCRDTWKAVRRLARGARVVIDLGSGGGTLLYNVARCATGVVAGIDFSMSAIRGAARLVPAAGFACGDLLSLPVRDRAAYLVLSTMVIEHLDDRAFLKEAWRILKPGGCLVVTSVMKRPWAWYYLKNNSGERVLEATHLREYGSIEEFTALLGQSGFRVARCEASPIRFPVLDPVMRALFRRGGVSSLKGFTSSRAGNLLRKAARVPVPGYYSIEALCVKTA